MASTSQFDATRPAATGSGRCALCESPLGAPAFPYETLWNGREYCFRRCQECATASLDPMPDPAEQKRIFSYGDYHAVHYASVPDEKHERALRALAAHAPAARRLLDFGCGSGAFLHTARRRGYDCEGIEYERSAIVEARKLSGVLVRSYDEVIASGDRFDVVRVGHVVTSLPRPKEELRSLEALIAPGGVLLLENAVENNPSIAYWLTASGKAVRRRLGFDPGRAWVPTVVWRTDAATLRGFLARMGYRERYYELFDDGWPLHAPEAPLTGLGPLIKRQAARLAVALSRHRPIGRHLGNQCLVLLEPNDGEVSPGRAAPK